MRGICSTWARVMLISVRTLLQLKAVIISYLIKVNFKKRVFCDRTLPTKLCGYVVFTDFLQDTTPRSLYCSHLATHLARQVSNWTKLIHFKQPRSVPIKFVLEKRKSAQTASYTMSCRCTNVFLQTQLKCLQ